MSVPDWSEEEEVAPEETEVEAAYQELHQEDPGQTEEWDIGQLWGPAEELDYEEGWDYEEGAMP